MPSSAPTVVLADALTKVTPRWEPSEPPASLSGWQGETVSFQIAWRPVDTDRLSAPHALRVALESDGPVAVSVVDLVPVQVPCWEQHDDGSILDQPGMLPDVLRPTGAAEVTVRPTHIGWHALWVDVTLPASEVRVNVTTDDAVLLDATLPVATVGQPLPEHGVEYTQWFHADCLATHYDVEPWSEAHWGIVEQQLRAAREMGVTSVLTPVWTPPLDTAVGTYRRSTQLLDITLDGDEYSFGTDKLDRWMNLLATVGMREVEVPHLFTQWGAKATPRFTITVDGRPQQRFGWDVPATDPSYQHFLAALVPFLKRYFDERVGLRHTLFHISDEPSSEHLDSYREALSVAKPLLDGARVVDALSHPDFVELVAEPVVATDAVPAFREAGIEPRWVYYCVGQSWDVSNRFIAQTAMRTRALGWQLYKSQAQGFLHWALNFYSRQLSFGAIDPFRETSAGGGFLSGDAFIVYPGPDGQAWPSLRHRLMRDAFDDLAAARGAEAVLGRDAVLAIIDPDGDLDYASGWVSGVEWLRRRHSLDEAVRDAGRRQG